MAVLVQPLFLCVPQAVRDHPLEALNGRYGAPRPPSAPFLRPVHGRPPVARVEPRPQQVAAAGGGEHPVALVALQQLAVQGVQERGRTSARADPYFGSWSVGTPFAYWCCHCTRSADMPPYRFKAFVRRRTSGSEPGQVGEANSRRRPYISRSLIPVKAFVSMKT